MISLIIIMLLFWHDQKLSQLDQGSKYCTIFLPPLDIFTPSNNQWQSFICLSYLLEKMYYYIKIILMISWLFMMLLFALPTHYLTKLQMFLLAAN